MRASSGQIAEHGSERRAFLGRAARGVLLVLPLILYVWVPTRNFYWDGVAFAVNIEKHLPLGFLVHPSHLLYSVWGDWLFRIAEAFGFHFRALFVLQAANGVLAGLCVILLYRSLRRRNAPAGLALAGAFLFAFSATWWKFASDANAYVPTILLLVCANFILERDRLLERDRPAVASGLAHAGAMLFHELAILFLPVALFRLRKSPRSMAIYLTAAFLPVAPAYFIAHRAALREGMASGGLLGWITSHAADSGFSFSLGTNFLLTARGTARLLVGGRLRDFARDPISLGALALLVLAVIALAVCLWRATREVGASRVRELPLYAALWAGVYVAFLFFWMPMNTFYRLFYWPPLVIIVIGMLRPSARTRDAVWAFAAVALLWNFTFEIYPQSRSDHNVPLRFAMAEREKWPGGTRIVFRRFHPDLWIISYFNQQVAWIGFEELDVARLDGYLEDARRDGKRLWMEQTAYDLVAEDAVGRRWLGVHERRDELLDFADAKHRFTFHSVK
jgi:hypothetical protein